MKLFGRNNNGIKVNSGIYMYKIQAGDFVETKKMILLK
ncbi:T9SS type A sorting domain-containing protein [candidate division KSB1 bacterium]